MKKSSLRQNVLALLAAVIWGSAFVAQSVAAPHVPPFAFNAIRSLIAFVLLIGVSAAFDRSARRRGREPVPTDRRALILGGICTGVFLAIASNLQTPARGRPASSRRCTSSSYRCWGSS